MHGAVLEPRLDRETGVTEHREHAPVVRERLGDEPSDAERPGSPRQLVQQSSADPPTLELVRHHERDLGLVAVVAVAEPIEAGDGDDLVLEERHHGLPPAMVDVSEPFDLIGVENRVHGEEAQVRRLVGEPSVEADEPVGIGFVDGTDHERGAVGEVQVPNRTRRRHALIVRDELVARTSPHLRTASMPNALVDDVADGAIDGRDHRPPRPGVHGRADVLGDGSVRHA